MTRHLKIFIYLLFGFFVSCSTEKNTMISRSYHNLTSHYNIYFNGYQSYEKGISRLQKNFEYNYSGLLPLFYYESPTAAQTVSSDMERAIDKASKVITLHSITAKPDIKRGIQNDKQKDFYNKKEYNKWIDDNYLLMGKAYVYKNQYDLAMEALRKVITDFPGETSRYEALIWMARVYNETGEFRESEKILNILSTEKEFPNPLKASLYSTYSDMFIKQGKYERAAEMLDKSLKYIKNKHNKIRYTYILAQLYEQTGNASSALKTYGEVIKMNPPYEMTFNAKINMARSFQAGSGNAEEINSVLKKLLKDDKNIEYKDQIYYAMGEIALKEGKTSEAIEDFKKSIEVSVSNYNQKGYSYLALGDLYYQMPQYSLAQAYYDSTLQNIAPEYEEYDMLSRKSSSLTHLVQYLQIYELEDSVQLLARLPEKERLARIDNIIENIRKQEEEQRQKEQEGLMDMQYSMMNSGSSNTGGVNIADQGDKWYFYNLNAKGFGQPEFRMKWGNRKLEDNWRRNSKQTLDFSDTNNMGTNMENGDLPQSGQPILGLKSREFYLANIPLTDSAMKQSELRIENALQNMGIVYRDELNDKAEAIKTFEEQIKRFPDGKLALPAYYNLYELYSESGNQAKSNYYKDLIIRKYPDNPRGKILADPDYVQQLIKEESRKGTSYEKAFEFYKQGNYEGVLSEVNYALKEFEGDKIIPRFRLLKALAEGGLHGKEILNQELEKIIEEFPEHEVSTYAQQLKEHLYTISPELEISDTRKKAEEIYRYKTEGTFFAGIASTSSVDINQLNFNLINFNLDNFNQQNLSLQQFTVGRKTIILIRSFKDQLSAEAYLDSIRKNEDSVFKSIDKNGTGLFLITPENFETMIGDNDYSKYSLFYGKYYQN